MRPPDFFSIAIANRFIHSCCPSLRVAVASFITIGVLWAWSEAMPVARIAVATATASAVAYLACICSSQLDDAAALRSLHAQKGRFGAHYDCNKKISVMFDA